MRSQRFRGVRAVAVVVVSLIVAVLVNVVTSGEGGWLIVALTVLAVLVWAALEWRNATPGQYRPGPPSPPGDAIPRPTLVNRVVELLTGTEGSRAVVLHGPPGFGKTYLARMAIADPRIRKQFGDKIHFVVLREDLRGAELTERILRVAVEAGGEERPGVTHPDVAGEHLGAVLAKRRQALLVIDDVWSREQVEPFLAGAPNCVRLITTRVGTTIPDEAVMVRVTELSDEEALQLLTSGLGKSPPRRSAKELLRVAGGMALFLRLVNRALRVRVREGATVADAARPHPTCGPRRAASTAGRPPPQRPPLYIRA